MIYEPGQSGVLRPSRTIIVPGVRRPLRRAMIPTMLLGQCGLSRMPTNGYFGWTPAQLTTPPKLWANETSGVTIVAGAASQWNERTRPPASGMPTCQARSRCCRVGP